MSEEKVKVEGQGQDETVTSGCPSLGLPRIPSGADGTEPEEGQRSKVKGQTKDDQFHCLTSDLGPLTLSRTDYEQIIADVFHKCNEAFIHAPQQREARQWYFKVVVGDLADALASVVPCDNRGRDVHVASDKDGSSADDATRTSRPQERRHDPADYWKVSEGVQLTRYKGTNVTRLIAVRKGMETNPDVIFEIFINATTKKATIKRDDTVLFTIGVDGLSARRVQTVAISALRSYLRENARGSRHGKERIHRRVAERQAAKKEEN